MPSRAPNEYSQELIECGRRVRFVRLFLGMSREEFGELLDVNVNAISNWETGNRRIGVQSILTLLREKQISSDFILDGYVNGLDQHTKTAWNTYKNSGFKTL